MKQMKIGDVDIKTSEDRDKVLKKVREDGIFDDESHDEVSALIGSCNDFKRIHPVQATPYTKKPITKFIQVLNYHADIELDTNEYIYDFSEDKRICILGS